jgi:hypothetical protein
MKEGVWSSEGKTPVEKVVKYSHRNLTHCHSVYHKCHMNWPGNDTGTEKWDADRLIACATARLFPQIVWCQKKNNIHYRGQGTCHKWVGITTMLGFKLPNCNLLRCYHLFSGNLFLLANLIRVNGCRGQLAWTLWLWCKCKQSCETASWCGVQNVQCRTRTCIYKYHTWTDFSFPCSSLSRSTQM